MTTRNGKRERVEAEEARPRRGGATRAQIVTEAEILKIIGKLKGANKYDGLEQMLKQLLVLQVECTVGDLSAFKIWLKLAKDSKRSLAEGTDALAVLLEVIGDVEGTLKRVQGETPLNAKMEAEQDAVRKIVPKARQHPALVHSLPTHHPCLCRSPHASAPHTLTTDEAAARGRWLCGGPRSVHLAAHRPHARRRIVRPHGLGRLHRRTESPASARRLRVRLHLPSTFPPPYLPPYLPPASPPTSAPTVKVALPLAPTHPHPRAPPTVCSDTGLCGSRPTGRAI